jgi:hypothetical protein
MPLEMNSLSLAMKGGIDAQVPVKPKIGLDAIFLEVVVGTLLESLGTSQSIEFKTAINEISKMFS